MTRPKSDEKKKTSSEITAGGAAGRAANLGGAARFLVGGAAGRAAEMAPPGPSLGPPRGKPC